MGFLRRAMGRMLNALGAPGFIRMSACRERLGRKVAVTVDDSFTTISIDNLRLLFRRVSGRLDGIIVEPTDCTGDLPAIVGDDNGRRLRK